MQLFPQNLQSFKCCVIKKFTDSEGQSLFFGIINEDSPQNVSKDNSVQQVTVFKAPYKTLQAVEDMVGTDTVLTLFADTHLSKQTLITNPAIDQLVAFKYPKQTAQLLYPKALQLMPYTRLLKESFLVAIPWLGLFISLFSLTFSVSSTIKRKKKSSKLRFTFPSSFHLISTLICCYPALLIYFSLNQYLPFAIVMSYFVLCLLNYCASKQRNSKVDRYNQAILTFLNTRSESQFNT